MIAAIFAEIKMSIQNSSLLVDFKMDHLPLLVDKIEQLAELLVITSVRQSFAVAECPTKYTRQTF